MSKKDSDYFFTGVYLKSLNLDDFTISVDSDLLLLATQAECIWAYWLVMI